MSRSSRWLLYGLTIGAAFMLVVGWLGFNSLGLKADWLAFYTAGKFLLEGRMVDLYSLPSVQDWQSAYIGQNITAFLYPPVYAYFFAPLGLLSPWRARIAWLVIGIAAAVLSASLSTRWSGLRLPISLLALLAFPPLFFSLVVGQTSPLSLLLFSVIAWLEYQGRKGFLPGVLAGLALFKPQLLIPLVFFWLVSKRWRSLAGFGAVVFAIVGLSWITSYQGSQAYVRLSLDFLELAGGATRSGANASIFASSPWLGILVALGVLFALVLFRGSERSCRFQAVLWISPVLVTPYLATYDLLLLFLPISFLFLNARQDRWLSVGIALIYLSSYLAIPMMTVKPVILFAVFLLVILIIRLLQIDKQQTLLMNSNKHLI